MRNIIYLFALFLALPFGMLAQQDPQYTQLCYAAYKLAYSGNREILILFALMDQWVGVEGA